MQTGGGGAKRTRSMILWERLREKRERHEPIIMRESFCLRRASILRNDYADQLNMTKTELSYFDKYIKAMRLSRTGNIPVYYQQNVYDEKCSVSSYLGSRHIGRMFGKDVKGNPINCAQSMKRIIRNTLFHDQYVEIDMVNCHPTIMVNMFEHVAAPYLLSYVENREAVFTKYPEIPPLVFKKVVGALLCNCSDYFGLHGDMASHHLQTVRQCRFFSALRCDIANIHDELKRMYPDYTKMIHADKDCKNPLGRTMAIFLQDIENDILMTMVDYIQHHCENTCDNLVLIYDALLVPKDVIDDPPSFLERLEKVIHEKFGFVIKLAIKDMTDPIITIDGEGSEDDDDDDEKVRAMDLSYLEWKAVFERNHYNLENPFSYVWVDHGDRQYFPQTKFVNEVCAEHPKEYLKEWIADPNKRKIRKEVFAPPPSILSCQGAFNMYDGLQAESIDLVPDNSVMELTERVRYHLWALGGGTKDSYVYLVNYLSLLVQKPGILMKVALAFRSVQGTGKDSFFSFIGESIIGHRYFTQAAQMSELFGDVHHTAIVDKLLVVVSEASRNDVKSVMNRLKSFITAPTVSYRPLYMPLMTRGNFASVVIFGQDQQFLQIEGDDRRFAVFSPLAHIANKTEYFKPLIRDYDNPKVARAFYQYLLSHDISGFHASADRPMTTERMSMISFNSKLFRVFLYKCIDTLYHEFTLDNDTFTTERSFRIQRSMLHTRYQEWADSTYTARAADFTMKKCFLSDLHAEIGYHQYVDDNGNMVFPIKMSNCSNVKWIKVMIDKVMEKYKKEFVDDADKSTQDDKWENLKDLQ